LAFSGCRYAGILQDKLWFEGEPATSFLLQGRARRPLLTRSIVKDEVVAVLTGRLKSTRGFELLTQVAGISALFLVTLF
jgi:hypothetical protein